MVPPKNKHQFNGFRGLKPINFQDLVDDFVGFQELAPQFGVIHPPSQVDTVTTGMTWRV